MKEEYINIELFSGSGNLTRTLNNYGMNTISIDKRKRKGICEPDIRMDIMSTSMQKIKKVPGTSKVFALWIGLPCTIWSNASGDFYLDRDLNPKNEKCAAHLKLLEKTLRIIDAWKPVYWYIENPRGRLRYYRNMIKFMIKNKGMIKELTMSSYGFESQKPTNIFTNDLNLRFKDLDSFGRGNKSTGNFENLTTNQRQSYPDDFCKEVAGQILEKYPGQTKSVQVLR